MVKRWRGVVVTVAAAASWLSAGCLESTITASCTVIAQTQCDRCFTCATDAPGTDPQSLCSLSAGVDRATCEEQLIDLCENQTSARQQTRQTLERCEAAIEGVSCEQLYQSAAQRHERTVPECALFL